MSQSRNLEDPKSGRNIFVCKLSSSLYNSISMRPTQHIHIFGQMRVQIPPLCKQTASCYIKAKVEIGTPKAIYKLGFEIYCSEMRLCNVVMSH